VDGYAVIGLDNPKSYINVGSILRAADAYGALFVATTGRRFERAPTDTSGAYRVLPLLQPNNLREIIPFDCVPVAVELLEQAQPLTDYVHPRRAFYIFGAEDATLGARITDWCRDVIYIPTKICTNLAATVNVVLYDRMNKESN
jgi:tRNA(Leu) C34 or U34 (ribose-2'-O)-methylase TrmL